MPVRSSGLSEYFWVGLTFFFLFHPWDSGERQDRRSFFRDWGFCVVPFGTRGGRGPLIYLEIKPRLRYLDDEGYIKTPIGKIK